MDSINWVIYFFTLHYINISFIQGVSGFTRIKYPESSIEKVLDVIRFGPTGHNDQDVKYSIFTNREVLKSIADSVVDFLRFLVKTEQDQQLPFDLNNLIEENEKGVG